MNFEDLSPELQAKARACKDIKELVALAEMEGHELSDDELSSISGGAKWNCIDHRDCSDCPDHCASNLI